MPPKYTRLLIYFVSFIVLVYSGSLLRSFSIFSPLPVSEDSGHLHSNHLHGNHLHGNDKSGKNGQNQSKEKGVLNPHNFEIILENQKICHSFKKVNLLILVTSSVANFDRRQAIRSTWGSEYLAKEGAVLMFLLANPLDSAKQKKVVEEFEKFADIIQEDFVDSYMNLTLKTIMGIKWASINCRDAEFVMKTDDDIYVNVPFLMDSLAKLKEKRIFYGCVKQQKAFAPVLSNSKGASMPPAHPLFVAGAGYVFSGSLLSELYSASLKSRMIPVEDVYVSGHLAKATGTHPPLHDHRFTCGEIVVNDCDMIKAYTGHKITPERMYNIWDSIGPNVIYSACYNKR